MMLKLNIPGENTLCPEAQETMPVVNFKLSINEPTGNFFYDPWKIKTEFKNSVWDKLLNMLDRPIGEARLLKMDIEQCYTKHADIDNRWHYPITGNDSFLIDLENNAMHELEKGCWYYMDAGRVHSAVNFGCDTRVSLVVRELLTKAEIIAPKKVTIRSKDAYNSRFLFDSVYSTFLNRLNRQGKLSSFSVEKAHEIFFITEHSQQVPKHKEFIVNEY